MSEFCLDQHRLLYGFCKKGYRYSEMSLREFVNLCDKQLRDFGEDIIALIEISNSGKKDLIEKMARLCRAHKIEIDKLVGKHLIAETKVTEPRIKFKKSERGLK